MVACIRQEVVQRFDQVSGIERLGHVPLKTCGDGPLTIGRSRVGR